jgi:hypothetical protein
VSSPYPTDSKGDNKFSVPQIGVAKGYADNFADNPEVFNDFLQFLFAGGGGGLGRNTKGFLNRSLTGGGFPLYQGDMVAGLSPELTGLLAKFFAAGPEGGFNTALSGLTDVAGADSVGRASSLLAPSRERAIQEFTRRTRERSNLGNNLLSSGTAEAESRGIADIFGAEQAQLAQLIPGLDANRLDALAKILPLFAGSAGLGSLTQQNEQAQLDAMYKEFLRTDPAAGVLDKIFGFRSSAKGATAQYPEDKGPTGAQTAISALAALAPLFAAL